MDSFSTDGFTGFDGHIDDLFRPEWIGRYRVLDLLGEGGMGLVYLAEQREPIRRKVAVKLIKVGMDTREVLARFDAERQALALMDHPNIAAVYDAGVTEQGRPYFAMEYVPGVPLTDHCNEHRLRIPERLRLFQQVCDAVQHAHQKGVIHRDLKPVNILVRMDGDRAIPKIIDFGIAKATNQRLTEATIYTEESRIIGTPEYMSPEQARLTSEDVDTRTDIYALGLVLYKLLVGVLPFDADRIRKAGYTEIQRMILEEEPAKPSSRLLRLGDESRIVTDNRRTELRALTKALRGDLDWITMKSIEKDRTRRYGNASELAQDLERHLRKEPVAAGPPGVAYRCGKFVRRNRGAVAAVSAIFVVLAAGLVASWLLYREAQGNLEEVLRLTAFSHARLLTDATAEADELWPESSENVPHMESWLERARSLMRHESWHRDELERLRQEAVAREATDARSDPVLLDERGRLEDLRSRLDERERELAALRSAGAPAWGGTVLSSGAFHPDEHKACYFRASFDVDDPGGLSGLRLRFRVDDGAVFWLNGAALYRSNVPDGVASHATLARLPVWGDRSRAIEESPILSGALRRGPNEIGVAVYPWDRSSADLYLDLEVVGVTSSGDERILVPMGASWRFHEGSEAPEAGWQTRAVDWPEGLAPFGYGLADRAGRAAELPHEIFALRGSIDLLRARIAGRKGWEFREESQRWRHETLEDLVRAFEAFRETIEDVERRLSFAREVRRRTIGDHADEWKRVCEAVADPGACPVYRGLTLSPQEGLVPLGRDPRTGLFEFAHLRTGRPPRRDPSTGDLEITEETGIVLVLVPPGAFRMGATRPGAAYPPGASNVDPLAERDEAPVHEVSLDAFFISKYEMTQGQWSRATGESPSFYGAGRVYEGYRHDLRHPVENVDWGTYDRELRRLGLLLPTEAQWEYSARGGTDTPWWTGGDKESLRGKVNVADECCRRNGAPTTWRFEEGYDDGFVAHAPVGTFSANAYGLHEVAGNVWEMCRDGYTVYELPAREGDGLRSVDDRRGHVFRGGSFTFAMAYCRSADRDTTFTMKYRIGELGVRPSRAILPGP